MDFIDLKTPYRQQKQLIQARINQVLEHGQYILGPEVGELEERLAAYTGAAHCVTVASGTEALLIALMALGVKAGDEIITTPFSFIATAEVIALLGAIPVFVDVEADTGNIDSTQIEDVITAKTCAIMPVSLYGQPANMDAINEIATRHGLPVVEDAAQSFGADYSGRKSCNLSTIGCTSFFPSKPLGCYGDGGAIFTNDARLAQACREIRVHGQERRYYHTRIGVGGRMDTLQCAIVLAKLDSFASEVEARKRIGARYTAELAPLKATGLLDMFALRDCRASVYAQYAVLVRNREVCLEGLKARNIPTAVHYPLPLHRQPALQEISRFGSLRVAEKLAQQVICLPMHPYLEKTQQDRVVQALSEVLRT